MTTNAQRIAELDKRIRTLEKKVREICTDEEYAKDSEIFIEVTFPSATKENKVILQVLRIFWNEHNGFDRSDHDIGSRPLESIRIRKTKLDKALKAFEKAGIQYKVKVAD